MIRGIHGLFYSSEPDATRDFLRNLVKLPGVDIGEGWWIFDFAEGDLGVHPVDDPKDAGGHDVSFYCDDIHGTVAALQARGVEFDGEVADHGYGLVTYIRVPGGIRVQLYEPRYSKGPKKRPRAAARSANPAKKKAAAKKTAKKKTGKQKKTANKKPAKTSAAKKGKKSRRGR